MRKIIKSCIVIFALFFMFSGCKSNEDITVSKPITHYEKIDLQNIEKIKEQKVEEGLKKEFLALFEDFSSFEFENYFFVPEESKYSCWEVTEETFLLYSSYILSQNEVDELLQSLRKNNYFRAYYNRSDISNYRHKNSSIADTFLDTGRKNRQNCFTFERNGIYIDTYVTRSVLIDILQIKDSNDMYLVDLTAIIGRNPPSGKSWPRPLSNHPALTFLNQSGEPIDPSNINWDDYSDLPIHYPND